MVNAEAGARAPLRILIVEDEPLIAADIAFMLRRAGYAPVGPAHDESEASALLDSGAVDLAILDVNLGETWSFETADRLGAQGVPFFFLTGHARRIIDRDFGAHPMLTKPFRERDLLAKVRATAEAAGRG